MKQIFIGLLILAISIINSFGQKHKPDYEHGDDSVVEGYDEGNGFNKQNKTGRNYPLAALKPYKIDQCRKADSIPVNFYRIYVTSSNLQDPSLKNIEDLTKNDMDYLCKLAWDTKEKRYFDLLTKLIFTGNFKKNHEMKMQLTMCLSAYNTKESKNVLVQLLDNTDKGLAIISAIDLVQLGEKETGLTYLSKAYLSKNYYNMFYSEQVNTALMQINSAESVALLKKLSQDETYLSGAIDALAALSLLGYCDYSFKSFALYAKSENDNARIFAAICLAYYTGTPEAFEIINNMQNDKSKDVKEVVKMAIENYKLNQNARR
jgi:hypothetical protein